MQKFILNTLVTLLFVIHTTLLAQEAQLLKKPIVAIEEFTEVKVSGIMISPQEMTKILFEEIENSNKFKTRYLPKGYQPDQIEDADVLIQGDYELEGNLVTLNYQFNMLKTKSRIKLKANRVELSEIKKEILANIAEIFVEVTIKSEPNFCLVEIDGLVYGKTPLKIENLLTGTHLLHLTKDGYFGLYQEAEISKNETLNYTLDQHESDRATSPAPIGGVDAITNIIKYPERYAESGIDGDILVLVEVNEKGEANNVVVKKSQGDPEVDLAVVKAIKKVDWEPAKLNGQAVSGSAQLLLKFTQE